MIDKIFQIIAYLIVFAPFIVIFIRGFDRVCIWLFDRYKNEVFINLKVPNLSEEQRKLYKERLHFANHNSDQWYMADMDCVDKLCDGQSLNYLDLVRLQNAISWFPSHYEGKIDRSLLNQISNALGLGMRELEKEIKARKNHDKLLNEQDIASKQILLAKLSTVAALFSAIAAIAASYLAYLQFLSMSIGK